MKKFAIGLMAMSGLLFTACDTTPKDSTAKVSYPAFNLVTPLDGGESYVSASPCWYNFDFNLSKGEVAISTNELKWNGSNYTFTTDIVEFMQSSPYNGLVYFMKGMTANVNNNTTLPLKNARFLITSNFAYAKPNWSPIHPGLIYNGSYVNPVVVASYQVGEDFTVKTFMTDSFYTGTTYTTYPIDQDGNKESYKNEDMYYRVLIDIEKKKADIIMYRAKFSGVAAEQEKAVVYLMGLDVAFANGNYTIKGENIVPKLYEGGQLEDYPSFKIDFTMQTTGPELVGATMNYTVYHTMRPGMDPVTYTGSFNGLTVGLPDIADYK